MAKTQIRRKLSKMAHNRINENRWVTLEVLSVNRFGCKTHGVDGASIVVHKHLEFCIGYEDWLRIEPERASAVKLTDDEVIFYSGLRERGRVPISSLWD